MRKIVSTVLFAFLLIVMLVISGLWYLRGAAHGFSARDTPTSLEVVLARQARHLSISQADKKATNPIVLTPRLLAEARRHFADHCASCHANDGSGNTEIGRMLYPRPPDMRESETQSLSDGELYFVIHNGIRMSGMPAWGGNSAGDPDSWKLVHFIRHLPVLSQEEIDDMKNYNPKTLADMQEEKNEEDFLNGKSQD